MTSTAHAACEAFTQLWQMQALPRRGSGTCCKSCALNCSREHQQGACSLPACGRSMAQWLGLPHSGQWQASIVGLADMRRV